MLVLCRIFRQSYTTSLIGRGNVGIIDSGLKLGKPFQYKKNAVGVTVEQQFEKLLQVTFPDPHDQAICEALIETKKIKRSLHPHQFITAVKKTKLGLPIPDALRPIDLTAVPKIGETLPHLTYQYKGTGGRSALTGRITVRHRGGGDKRLIYILDTKRQEQVPQKVLRIETQVRRSAKIALLQNMADPPLLSYILAPEGVTPGQIIPNDNKTLFPGNSLQLKNIPVGTFIYSIELRPGQGAKFVRAAGTKARLVGYTVSGEKAIIEMPSKKRIELSCECRASIGQASHPAWRNRVLGKAGAKRRLGWRPTVRGVAMNPVDHPHGGGKGGESKGNLCQNPWGKVMK